MSKTVTVRIVDEILTIYEIEVADGASKKVAENAALRHHLKGDKARQPASVHKVGVESACTTERWVSAVFVDRLPPKPLNDQKETSADRGGNSRPRNATNPPKPRP